MSIIGYGADPCKEGSVKPVMFDVVFVRAIETASGKVSRQEIAEKRSIFAENAGVAIVKAVCALDNLDAVRAAQAEEELEVMVRQIS